MKIQAPTLSIAAALIALIPQPGRAGPPPFTVPPGLTLYATDGGVSGDASSIYDVDPTTGMIGTPVGTTDTTEIYSLATEPGTDRIHCVYRDDEDEPLSLGTIVPSTGAIAKVFDFIYEGVPVEDGLPGIAFDCDGNLFAVSAGRFPDASMTPTGTAGMIFSVDRSTGDLSLIATGSGGRGHALEYNPRDGLLYHFFSSRIASMETIDPRAPATPVPVPLTGDSYDMIQAVVYAGNGQFVAHQVGLNSFYLIASSGVVTYLGPSPAPRRDRIRGLAFDRAIGCHQYQPDLLIGKKFSRLRVNDFYTRTGTLQMVKGLRLSGRRGSSFRLPFEIQNDGTAPDQIRLRWNFSVLNSRGDRTGTGPRFRRQVFRVGGGRLRNVTGSILNQGIALDPGEQQRFVFQLTVRRLPARKISRRSTTFRIQSVNDPSKVDTGGGFFKIDT